MKRNMRAILLALLLSASACVAILIGGIGLVNGVGLAKPISQDALHGAWQIGPDMDATLWGGPAGNGFARFSGYYYASSNRVFFLGGRGENNIISGAVFYLDPVTQSFTTTGQTMQTPVSNYFISQLEDGSGYGPGLYIVGGRLNDGTATDAVQVYYPDTNSVDTITTDPFPLAARSFGGQSVVDNKLYVFGGFDGTSMYTETYVYDPSLPEGTRWSDAGCDLPTGRAFIAVAVVGTKIYAIGGDELIGNNPAPMDSTLDANTPTVSCVDGPHAQCVPIDDTLVLDTADLAACWSDGAMADLPSANANAPAVYVDEGYLAGGIYVIGGLPTSGTDRQVFRYDLATDTWEDFPQLAIPDPATGRRNQAAVYLPASAGTLGSPSGLGDGVPGIWTFGGYDGSAVGAMTNTTELFSVEAKPVLVLPDQVVATIPGGGAAAFDLYLLNRSGMDDSYDLSYTADVTWTVSLPASIGPVVDGSELPFTLTVSEPLGLPCPVSGVFTVTATSQTDPLLTDSQAVSVQTACGLYGTVTDQNTGLPLENAYVWVQDTVDGLGTYYDQYTSPDGKFIIDDAPPGNYYMGVSHRGYQASFFPDGWPAGALLVTIADNTLTQDVALAGSRMDWDPAGFSATLITGEQLTATLTLSNTGSGPLYYSISRLDGDQNPPPPTGLVAGLPRVDPQVFADLAASPAGTAEFVVILSDQADLSPAYAIPDWSERGKFVYATLSAFAQASQLGLRNFLSAQKIDFTPLYILNAVIVHAGNADLVDALAARPDVAQVVANHAIPVEEDQPASLEQLLGQVSAPATIEWNILKVKANQVWNDYAVTGEGIVVAEIDTGTQWDHPALKAHYRGWNGVSVNHNYNWYDPYHQSPGGGAIPADTQGHGTHVMGPMVGDDGGANQIGMAPGAKWIACKGSDDVSGNFFTDELLQCAQWILAPTDVNGNHPDPTKRPQVVNNSWGGGAEDYWFTGAVAAWRASGIFPAFENGDGGPDCSTAQSPGDYWNTFASGATDSSNAIYDFSGRGPSAYTQALKPQVSAPGVNIKSSWPTNSYNSIPGTGMASAHTAGAVALLWSADPELIGQVDLTAWVLEQAATPLYTGEGCGGDLPDAHPNNTFGYGLLDVKAAVDLARGGEVTPDWVSLDPPYGAVPAGGTARVAVVFTGAAQPGTLTGTLWLVADDPYTPEVRLPLELVTTVRYGVALAPAAATLPGTPGQVVAYPLAITNTGTTTDTFELTAVGNAWQVSQPAEVTLGAGEGTGFQVAVTVPANAVLGDADSVSLQATSQRTITATATSVLTTTVPSYYGLGFSPARDARSGLPGEAITYTLQLTNHSGLTDTVDLAVSGNAWGVALPSPLTLGGRQSVSIEVIVVVPVDTLAGEMDEATVTATSQGDPAVSAVTTLSSTGQAVYGLLLAPAEEFGAGKPGDSVAYELLLTNTGNLTDTFDLVASGNTWTVTLPVSPTLGTGENSQVNISVLVPAEAMPGDSDSVTVTARSRGSAEMSAITDIATYALPAGWVWLPYFTNKKWGSNN